MEIKYTAPLLMAAMLAACVAQAPTAPAQKQMGDAAAVEVAAPIEPPQIEAATEDTVPTLGFTSDQYVAALEKVIADLPSISAMTKLERSNSANGYTVTVKLTDGAAAVLTVNTDTGLVNAITFTGKAASGTEGMALIIMAGAVVNAAFPEEQRGAVKAALGNVLTGLEINGKTQTARVGDNVVAALLSSAAGFVVVVEPAEE